MVAISTPLIAVFGGKIVMKPPFFNFVAIFLTNAYLP